VIKWFIKWTFRLIVLLVVMAVVLILSLDAIVKAVVVQQVRAATGMEAEIGTLDVGLLSPVFSMRDLKVYNSAEYGGTPFVNMPELFVEYDRWALLKLKLHITLLRLNLAEVNVVRSDTGKTNVVNGVPRIPPRQRADLARWFGGIDVLNLSLGKAKYVDLKNPQANRQVTLNMKNAIFKNLKTVQDVQGALFLLSLRSNLAMPGGNGNVAPVGSR
jgi:uncharacterized protein involved in outer membrane biogenesis